MHFSRIAMWQMLAIPPERVESNNLNRYILTGRQRPVTSTEE
jgi:hypothetical protein